MTRAEAIAAIFPTLDDIPPQFHLDTPVEQTEYLIDGQLHHWDGPVQQVYSGLFVEGEAGLERQLIGYYPLLTATESLQALDA
ncbi:MAG: NADP-dependent glyceraldehyde-3-phosphate dehydrogenase, partial [Anaerolineae bacterium]|nr:NADP-dependent glyceraldehyde-3-phosphate dehydrogenase [Anaerolineae bacterium]